MIGALLVLQLASIHIDAPPAPPGAVDAAVTWKTAYRTICAPTGWTTAVVRPPSTYTTALKRRQLAALGYTVANPLPRRPNGQPDVRACVARSATLACYEEDHLIPLTLGGHPTDPRNLWPQPIAEALQKDRLEQRLHHLVCAGRVELVAAQRAIATDWRAAARFYLED